ncbi:MAG: hypothetical protein ABEI98_00375 [Halorhabdus sp.]
MASDTHVAADEGTDDGGAFVELIGKSPSPRGLAALMRPDVETDRRRSGVFLLRG